MSAEGVQLYNALPCKIEIIELYLISIKLESYSLNRSRQNMESPKQTLLIVDDAVENIDIVVTIFKDQYKVKAATNGRKALQIIKKSKKRPDLILLDVVMPELDGFDTIKELKGDEHTKNIPVIFLTSEAEPEKVLQAFSLGAVDYVQKPFNIDELRSRVNTHMLIKQQRDVIEEQNMKYREILHILSHDLNNSVGAIKMAVDLKAMNPSFSLDKFAPTLALAAENSINLIKMTCEICRMDEYSLESSDVNILQTFKDAELLLAKRFKDKKIDLELSIPEYLTAFVEQRAFLNSVVLNLLTNAIKFSSQNSTIQVEVSQVAENNVRISVRDFGIGMPDSIIENLFDTTQKKVRVGTSGEKGTGFGLPMVKKFVDIFGGSIEVISRTVQEYPNDHGTEFRIELHSQKAPSAFQ